jgi:hypothetical protein
MLAIGSTPSFDDGALGSFAARGASRSVCSGPRRPARSSAACWAASHDDAFVVVLIVVRSFHQEARDETGLIDGERVLAGRFAD